MSKKTKSWPGTYPAANSYICLLENGKKVIYSHCDKDRDGYDSFPVIKKLRYLGKGKIYSIGGNKHTADKTYHFWIREEKQAK